MVNWVNVGIFFLVVSAVIFVIREGSLAYHGETVHASYDELYLPETITDDITAGTVRLSYRRIADILMFLHVVSHGYDHTVTVRPEWDCRHHHNDDALEFGDEFIRTLQFLCYGYEFGTPKALAVRINISLILEENPDNLPPEQRAVKRKAEKEKQQALLESVQAAKIKAERDKALELGIINED